MVAKELSDIMRVIRYRIKKLLAQVWLLHHRHCMEWDENAGQK